MAGGLLLDGAVEGARRDDVVYVGLCLSTAAMIVAHTWLAIAALRVAPRPGG